MGNVVRRSPYLPEMEPVEFSPTVDLWSIDREVESLKFIIRIPNTEIRTYTTGGYYLTS